MYQSRSRGSAGGARGRGGRGGSRQNGGEPLVGAGALTTKQLENAFLQKKKEADSAEKFLTDRATKMHTDMVNQKIEAIRTHYSGVQEAAAIFLTSLLKSAAPRPKIVAIHPQLMLENNKFKTICDITFRFNTFTIMSEATYGGECPFLQPLPRDERLLMDLTRGSTILSWVPYLKNYIDRMQDDSNTYDIASDEDFLITKLTRNVAKVTLAEAATTNMAQAVSRPFAVKTVDVAVFSADPSTSSADPGLVSKILMSGMTFPSSSSSTASKGATPKSSLTTPMFPKTAADIHPKYSVEDASDISLSSTTPDDYLAYFSGRLSTDDKLAFKNVVPLTGADVFAKLIFQYPGRLSP